MPIFLSTNPKSRESRELLPAGRLLTRSWAFPYIPLPTNITCLTQPTRKNISLQKERYFLSLSRPPHPQLRHSRWSRLKPSQCERANACPRPKTPRQMVDVCIDVGQKDEDEGTRKTTIKSRALKEMKSVQNILPSEKHCHKKPSSHFMAFQ